MQRRVHVIGCFFLFKLIPAKQPFLDVGTEIKSGLCGLVVSHILCRYADAVNRIFEESMEPVIGWQG